MRTRVTISTRDEMSAGETGPSTSRHGQRVAPTESPTQPTDNATWPSIEIVGTVTPPRNVGHRTSSSWWRMWQSPPVCAPSTSSTTREPPQAWQLSPDTDSSSTTREPPPMIQAWQLSPDTDSSLEPTPRQQLAHTPRSTPRSALPATTTTPLEASTAPCPSSPLAFNPPLMFSDDSDSYHEEDSDTTAMDSGPTPPLPPTPPLLAEPTDTAATSRTRRPRRKNCCPFCQRMLIDLGRHVSVHHRDREEVKRYIELESEGPTENRRKMRAEITNKLRKLGNSLYNRQVVEGKRVGALQPVKRSSHDKHTVTNLTHVTCKHCSGLLRKDSLYRHLQRCGGGGGVNPPNPRTRTKNTILANNARLLVNNEHTTTDQLLREEVFPKMQFDEVTVVAQSDSLITKYGALFRFTHRGPKQIYYCSSRMRGLARLLITMKESRPDEIREFRHCIQPKNFKLLAESVRKLSGYDYRDGETKAPSVPPRLCSSLKRCANIIKSEVIQHATLSRSEKTEIMYEMNDFIHLMDRDWATEVGTNSENSRKRKRVMKPDLLPNPEDIRTVSRYIHDLCPSYVKLLDSKPTVAYYEKLAKLIIAHLITFNRRRPSETVEITLQAYHTTLNQRTLYGQDVQTVLTAEELKISEQLSIFYTSANKNMRKVPILLTKTLHEAIEALISARDKIGVKSKYLFGRPGDEELFHGSVVLKEIANKAQLKDPTTFTANALRHHAATSSQLYQHDAAYIKRLSTFLGHDLATHEHFYDLQLPLIHKGKVGPRMLAMIEPKPCGTSTAAASSSAHATRTATVTSASTPPPSTSTAPPPPPDRGEEEEPPPSSWCSPVSPHGSRPSTPPEKSRSKPESGPQRKRRRQRQRSEIEGEENTSTTSTAATVSGLESPLLSTHRGKRTVENDDKNDEDDDDDEAVYPPKKKHAKRRWSDAEKKTLYERFAHNFLMNLLPPRSEIRQVWEEEPSLKGRSLQQVVTYVNNIILKKQSIATPMRKRIKSMVAKGNDKLSP